MRPPTAVVLTKAARASSTLPRTLDSIRSAGIEPRLIISTYTGPNPDAEVRRQGHRALMAARNDPMGLVFFEDDIVLDPVLFPLHLGMAVARAKITAFCAVNRAHYAPEVLEEAGPTRARLEPMPFYAAPVGRHGGYHGSMAVYLPPDVVNEGASHPEHFQRGDGSMLEAPVLPSDFQHGRVTGFDMWIKWVAQAAGGILVAVPNSVDHLGDAPSERWRSPTYGRAWTV